MQLPPLTDGRIVSRYKRFFADIQLDSGEVVVAHCPNTGAMTGCWAENAPVQISYNDNPKRKLRWTLERVDMGAGWIGVNTYRPNQVIAEALEHGAILPLAHYHSIKRETPYLTQAGDKSRIDFRLSQAGLKDALVEVKSVTLFDGERLRFPDAVSQRGLKHIHALEDAVTQGIRGIMLYAINRPEGNLFSPASDIDPAYAAALNQAVNRGVEVIALRLTHADQAIITGEQLSLDLTG